MSSSPEAKMREGVVDAFIYSLRPMMEKQIALGGLHKSCLSCVAFDEPSEFCRKYQARPPARVIAFGCPGYFDEETIPF